MATQYTPEEIAEIFEAYNNAIKTNTPISAELAKQMQDASRGFKGATDELNKFAKSIGTSAAQFTKAMYEGQQGMNAMGGAVDGVGTALEFLIGLIPGARLLKIGLTLLTKVTVGATKVLGDQSDKLYKTYQDLSRAGAATAGGMTEVFENMQKLGYGLAELDQMTQLVKANSKELGLFLGTVGQGARVLADTAESIQRSGIQREFLNMGLKVDDINKGIAGYIVQQGRLGKLQGQTQAELNAGARAYVKEMEILTRLTGQSREEMEQQRAQAETIDQFYAVVSELEPGKAAEVQKVFNHLMSIDPTGSKARGFAESVSGFQGFSEDQNKLYMATGGALAANMEALKNGTLNSAQFLDKLGMAIKANETNLRGFAKTGSGADAFGGLASNMRLANKATLGFEQSAADAANSLKPLDGVTDTATGMRQDQMRARDSLQSFVKLGVKPATDALASLASGGAALAGALPGGGGTAPMGGGGGGGGGAGGGSGSYIDQIDSGRKGPSILRRLGMAIGAVGAYPHADLSGLRMKSAEATAGGSTSEQLAGVARAIQDKLGGDLQYFSAFNDTYDRGGKSLHGQGRALDFTLTDSSKAAAVASMIGSIPGISKVIDEYANPSRSATGGHIHAEISAANGAILSGPTSGYRPNLTMHGTEAIVPLNSPAAQSAFGSSDQTNLMSAQLDKLDELVRVMQNQVSVSTKILQAAA